MLVLSGIFRTASCAYLRKGHTHEDLDGIFGQIATELSYSAFDTLDQLIDILLRRLDTVAADKPSKGQSSTSIDTESRITSDVYVLNDVSDWHHLTSDVGATFEQHGGPNAPHVFKQIHQGRFESRASQYTWRR